MLEVVKKPTLGHDDYERLGAAIREQILRAYTQDSCIATTKATIATLRQIGIDAFPLSVVVMAFNKPVWEWSVEHDRFPEVGTDEFPPDGYSIGIGIGEPQEGKWVGHLVTIAERKWLLDYSIDQGSRPEVGLPLKPVALPIEEKWLRGKQGHAVFQIGDVRLYYSVKAGDRSFESSPNWSGETAPVVHLRTRSEL